jgi:hypothetical protein
VSEINKYLRAKTSQLLSAGALSYTTSFASNMQLMQVLFHFSGSTTETVTCTLVSRDDDNYSTVLDSSDLAAKTSYVFRPSGGCILMDGDELKVTCTNANLVNTVYVTIIAEPYGRQAAASITNPGL